MIIEFSVENFLSFKGAHTLSLVAGKGKEFPEHIVAHQQPGAVRVRPIPILKSCAVYGPNAGGKTNLLKAMAFMRHWILQSSKESQAGEPIPVVPFLLTPESAERPAFFETVFLHDGIRYRYGFSADVNRVCMEWLFAAPKGRETRCFVRDNEKFEFGPGFGRSHDLVAKTRENALFLSVAAQFNHDLAKELLRWFADWHIHIIGTSPHLGRSFDCVASTTRRERLLRFLRLADDSIADIRMEGVDLQSDAVPEGVRKLLERDIEKNTDTDQRLRIGRLVSYHPMYDQDGVQLQLVPFDFKDESKGTQRFFELAGCILHALDHGMPLVVDELESSLHPKMTRFILELFHNSEANPRNAQLIFVTHDLGLFNRHFFRRDQLHLVRKNDFGASELYALSDFKVRTDASYDKDYMEGRFGAVPVLDEPAAVYRPESGDDTQSG